MKNNQTVWLVGMVVFLTTAVIGWMNFAPVSDEADQEIIVTKRAERVKKSRSQESDQTMSRIRSIKDEGARIRAAIHMARTMPVSELRAWLENGRFSQRRGYALTLFEKIANERWRREDPEGFLDWAVQDYSRRGDVELVLKSQPELFSSVLSRLQESSQISMLFGALARSNPEIALQGLVNLKSSDYSQMNAFTDGISHLLRNQREQVLGLMDSMPEPLAELIDGHDLRTRLSNKDLYKETMLELIRREDGLQLVRSSNSFWGRKAELQLKIMSSLPAEWRNQFVKTSQSAMEWGKGAVAYLDADWEEMGFSPEQAVKLKYSAMSRLTQHDPESVLENLADLPDHELRRNLISNLAHSITRAEEGKKEELLALVPESDREMIDQQLAQIEAQARTSQKPLPQNASELVSQVLEVENGNYSYQLRSLANQWTAEQKQELVNHYRSLEGEDQVRMAGFIISSRRGMSQEMRGQAYMDILSNPQSADLLAAEGNEERWNQDVSSGISSFVVDYVQADSERAATWVAQLPEGDTRLWAMKNMANNWRNTDEEGMRNWLSRQSEAERQEVEKFLGE